MDRVTALGQVIREKRQALGLSQDKLAELAGLHRNFVGLIERGATASKRRLDILGGGCTGDCGLGVVSGN